LEISTAAFMAVPGSEYLRGAAREKGNFPG
jgi:hypothetical protein